MIKVKRIETVRRDGCFVVETMGALFEIFFAATFIGEWILFLHDEQKWPGRGYPLLIGSVLSFFGWKLAQYFYKLDAEEIKEPTEDP